MATGASKNIMQPAIIHSSAMPPQSTRITPEKNHRILVVDDNEAIHNDFRKILGCDAAETKFDEEEAAFFKEPERAKPRANFEMDFAFQGREALQRVQEAVDAGRRYAVVFMDVRMPPGWDGLETTLKLWEADPDLQIVICTAYSDYSWEEMMEMIAAPERILILKKPFDTIEVLQLAHALTEKWSLLQAAHQNVAALERTVKTRTRELEAANVRLEAESAMHKAAAERVREQAMLIEKARDAIIVCDMDDTIVFWNHGAERLYGWTAAEAVGRKILDLLCVDEAVDEFHKARKAVLEKDGWSGEMLKKNRDGQTVNVECHWTLMHDDQGRPKSVLAIDKDITEKKQIEAQFLRVQRMESIGTLAGGIAHDLNNILAPILMACDIMEPVSQQQREMVETVRGSAKRATELVKQVLSFARGVEGRRIELDVKHLIAEIQKIVGGTFPKNIQIVADFAPGLWTLLADPTQLHQVLMNLCVNARDAMPSGGKLTIGAENLEVDRPLPFMNLETKPGRYVLISVGDNGTGMTAEIKEKIFDPFFTTKEVGRGTGLGLSTTMGIIKSHGGFIDLASEPGKGTTFRIYLPAMTGALSIIAREEKEIPRPRGHGEVVLLVDDEESVLRLTQRTLERFGYRVITAKDGLEAVTTFMQHKEEIAVVLTDIMMPVMDGFASIYSLREIKPDVAVIVASGLKAETQMSQASEAGVKYFLSKPYTPQEVLSVLDEILHASKH